MDYFERVAKRVIQWLSDTTQTSAQYGIESGLRPPTERDNLVVTAENALRYYENQGQTWQRMAFIKARGVAGDMSLAGEFLSQLEPWVYRRYLSRSDITEIAALKRRLEKRVQDTSTEHSHVDSGIYRAQPGGLDDTKFLIQYLQLLNGGELPEVRIGNTLDAIAALERAGCLTAQERSVLDDNYRFFQRVEHRLQVVLGNTAQRLPTTDPDRRQFLVASRFIQANGQPDAAALEQQLTDRSERTSRILNNLLSETFTSESGEVAPETDLILEQSPSGAEVVRLLSPYRFHDATAAYKDLISLGQEQVSFLSSRRCRHFWPPSRRVCCKRCP